MKKAPLTVKHQERRRRALERFTIKPRAAGQDEKSYDAYVARKTAEREALRSRLGV